MRLALMLALVVLALAPVAAAASPASLAFTGPAEPIALDDGAKTIPLNLTLTLEQFSCMEDTPFPVHIRIAGSGAYVTLDTQSPTFVVPGDSYVVQPYVATITVNATLGPDPAAREGVVDLIATLSTENAGRCVTAGGFRAATANLTLRTTYGAANDTDDGDGNFTGELGSGNGTAPEGNETLGNETNETPDMEPTPATPKPRPGSGSKDYIGDYVPPGESAEKSVPAPGAMLALGAVACALLLRRKA